MFSSIIYEEAVVETEFRPYKYTQYAVLKVKTSSNQLVKVKTFERTTQVRFQEEELLFNRLLKVE